MKVAFATHPRCIEHRVTGQSHPERPERIQSVWKTLDDAGLTARMQLITATPVDEQWMRAVHSDKHIEILEWIAGQDKTVMIGGDTYALPVSYEIARLAAGAVVQTVDAVLTGAASNGLVAVRPPGHHATPDRPMGFCLLNNIAIGAQYARQQGVKRVMIVDYDVHHGNGTQDIFYQDDSVLFLSTHQYGMFYPGTGALKETGRGAGQGYTINVPLDEGHGDKSYAAIFEQIVWAAARRFQPELIMVSAGFDAHFTDPLAGMALSLTGYAHLTRELIRMAETLCGGKIVFVMEGGYDLTAVGHGVRNIAHALLGDEDISDPYGLAQGIEPDVQPLIDRVKQVHSL